jgi:hypothetical protein
LQFSIKEMRRVLRELCSEARRKAKIKTATVTDKTPLTDCENGESLNRLSRTPYRGHFHRLRYHPTSDCFVSIFYFFFLN